MQFSEFKEKLPLLSKAKLAGENSHFQLAPFYRERYNLEIIRRKHPKLAAVLILFFPLHNETAFVLTERAEYDGHHSKQISFPGGKKEKRDRFLIHTAIRETQEEIGVEITENYILKEMTEIYIPPSDFLVKPYLAFTDSTPDFTSNHEVKKILTPHISSLLNPNNQLTKEVETIGNTKLFAPGFLLENEFVWGATAMILNELKELMQEVFSF